MRRGNRTERGRGGGGGGGVRVGDQENGSGL